MEMKLELVPVPVTDVDRAKAFYTEQVGFNADRSRGLSSDDIAQKNIVVSLTHAIACEWARRTRSRCTYGRHGQ